MTFLLYRNLSLPSRAFLAHSHHTLISTNFRLDLLLQPQITTSHPQAISRSPDLITPLICFYCVKLIKIRDSISRQLTGLYFPLILVMRAITYSLIMRLITNVVYSYYI